MSETWSFVPMKGLKGTVQVLVRDNNVDQALRVLKKKMQREGVFREMKLRRNYEKPSERQRRSMRKSIARRAREALGPIEKPKREARG